jgi:hypothetical protein
VKSIDTVCHVVRESFGFASASVASATPERVHRSTVPGASSVYDWIWEGNGESRRVFRSIATGRKIHRAQKDLVRQVQDVPHVRVRDPERDDIAPASDDDRRAAHHGLQIASHRARDMHRELVELLARGERGLDRSCGMARVCERRQEVVGESRGAEERGDESGCVVRVEVVLDLVESTWRREGE